MSLGRIGAQQECKMTVHLSGNYHSLLVSVTGARAKVIEARWCGCPEIVAILSRDELARLQLVEASP